MEASRELLFMALLDIGDFLTVCVGHAHAAEVRVQFQARLDEIDAQR